MPKLLEPAKNRRGSLQTLAMDVVLESVLAHCGELMDTQNATRLKDAIAAIKETLFDHNYPHHIPWNLLADFCSRFLRGFNRLSPSLKIHHEAGIEIIMDVEIPGLRCEGRVLLDLDPSDASRLKGLEVLNLNFYQHNVCKTLKNFHLQNLTTFNIFRRMSDTGLEILGRNCKDLKIVRVPNSVGVTDGGLRALDSCGKLRFVDVTYCSVTQTGVEAFLSNHQNIVRLDHTANFIDAGVVDILSSTLTVRPSVDGVVFGPGASCSNAHLSSVVRKFPNLTNFVIRDAIVTEDDGEDEYDRVLGIYRRIEVGGLSVLKSLHKLTVIDIEMSLSVCENCDNFVHRFLGSIGTNITTLKYRHNDSSEIWGQGDLNSVFEFCPNLECLGFEYVEGLSIPPFQKLRELILDYPLELSFLIRIANRRLEIEFGIMSSLESLSAIDFAISFETVSSMMLDDTKFPKLTSIKTNGIRNEDLACIERIAYHNNLDFQIEYDPDCP